MFEGNGVLARLRRFGRALVVALLAATLGALGLGFGSWLGWHSAGPLPTTARATALAEAVFPGATVKDVTRDDRLFAYLYPSDNDDWRTTLYGSEDYYPGHVTLVLSGSQPAAALLSDASGRLSGDGWYVRQDPVYGLLAERDGIALRASVDDDMAQTPTDVDVIFERPEPGAAWWLGVLGWIVAVAAGWVLARWVVRSRSLPATVLLLAGGVVMLPHTLLTTLGFPARGLFAADLLPPSPAWGSYMELFRFLATLGVVAIVVALVVAAVTRWTARSGGGTPGDRGTPEPVSALV